VQVTGPIWDEDHYDQAALDSTDPANIPRQVRTRHLCRAGGRVIPDGACLLVSSRHWQEHAVGQACLHLPEVETVGASAGRTFKTGVGARAPRRVRFPSASAKERYIRIPGEKSTG
jgi:hypothetical protein